MDSRDFSRLEAVLERMAIALERLKVITSNRQAIWAVDTLACFLILASGDESLQSSRPTFTPLERDIYLALACGVLCAFLRAFRFVPCGTRIHVRKSVRIDRNSLPLA